jgi:hypothetical protein
MPTTSVRPCRWKVAAARMRIAALTKIARVSSHEVDRGKANGFADTDVGSIEPAGLHEGGVQVEVMRHHGRPEDADGQIKHGRVGDDIDAGDQPAGQAAPARLRQEELGGEAEADHGHQGKNDRLDAAVAASLQSEHEQHLKAHEGNADDERQTEQQLQGVGSPGPSRQPACARTRSAQPRSDAPPATPWKPRPEAHRKWRPRQAAGKEPSSPGLGARVHQPARAPITWPSSCRRARYRKRRPCPRPSSCRRRDPRRDRPRSSDWPPGPTATGRPPSSPRRPRCGKA